MEDITEHEFPIIIEETKSKYGTEYKGAFTDYPVNALFFTFFRHIFS